MSKIKTFITGVNGQAGATLAKELVKDDKNEVFGLIRRSSNNTTGRLKDILNSPNFKMIEGDICDPTSINVNLQRIQPDYLFHYAAQSHVATSFEQPHYTCNVNVGGTLNVLEGVRLFSPKTRMYNSSSSEMFGSNYNSIKESIYEPSSNVFLDYEYKVQNESTPFHPRSPYAASKVAAHYLCQNYREAYRLYIASGITFNFEGTLRGENFVTRKITKWIGQHYTLLSSKNTQDLILLNGGTLPKLKLGNINSYRDWSDCRDTVKAQWLMLQQTKPEDFVIASGQTQSVKDFLELAFREVGCNWQDWVEIDQSLFRPSEVEYLLGDATKARMILGWEPTVSFEQLVKEMVWNDIKNEN